MQELATRSVMDVIRRYAPREYRTTRNPRSRYTMRCPICNHDNPRNRDHFTVPESEEVFNCFVCGAQGSARYLEELLTGRPHEYRAPPPAPRKPSAKGALDGPRPPLQGCTVSAVAQTRGLNETFLRNELGWYDGDYYGTRSVVIPYMDPENIDCINRFRVGLDDGDRFRWARFREGQSTRLYGLWTLDWIRHQRYCILVEGETDYAALSQHDFPVLGVPGADNWRSGFAGLLAGLEVYAWREPDRGGETFISNLRRDLPQLRVIEAPPGVKDPCDLLQQTGADFAETMRELLVSANFAQDPLRYADAAILGCFYTRDQVTHASKGRFFRDYLVVKKQLFIEALPEDTEAQRRLKRKVRLCFDYFKAMLCGPLEEKYVQRYRCGEPVCPVCANWLVERFFNERPKVKQQEAMIEELRKRMEDPKVKGAAYRSLEKKLRKMEDAYNKSKADILRDHLVHPTIYRVDIGSMRLPGVSVTLDAPIQYQNGLKTVRDRLQRWWARFSDNYGKSHWFAANHIRSQRFKLEGPLIHTELLLLSEYDPDAERVLVEHFAHQTGLDPADVAQHVVVERYETVDQAIMAFRDYVVVRCEWDEVWQYEAWRIAFKGAKLIQGKGVFYGLSGSMPKGTGHAEADCPVCGHCTPIELGGAYLVADTETKEVTSPITGRKYLVLAEDGHIHGGGP